MKRRLIALLLVAAMAVSCLPLAFAAGEEVVTIYHTNDIHAYALSSEGGPLDIANVAALHKADPNSLLVDAGDFSLGGSNFGQMVDGASMYAAMEAADYDLGILGNHEFDKSVANFEEQVKNISYPIISSNISIKPGFESVSPYLANMEKTKIFEVNGHKIGFFSLDTPTLRGMVSPATLDAGGVVVDTNLPKVATECVGELKAKGAEVIIAVTHCGYTVQDIDGDETKYTSYHVAQVDGVDAVIDGHDHVYRLASEAENVDGTLVVSTGTALNYLGALEITFKDGKATIVSKDVTTEARANRDPETAKVLEDWDKQIAEVKNQVAFKSEANFWGGNLSALNAQFNTQTTAVARRGYTNAGQLMADVMKYEAEKWVKENGDDPAFDTAGLTSKTPVVAYFGGGSVRGSFKKGDVTLGDLMTAYSFSFDTDGGNDYITVSPKTLWMLIEHGVNIFKSQDAETGFLTADGSIHGRFPQFAGLSYTYDINEPASGEAVVDGDHVYMPTTIGTRVKSITLDDGTVLDKDDDETRIVLVTGDYQMAGGDGYWMLGYAEDWDGYFSGSLNELPMGEGWYLIDYVNDVLGGTIPANLYPLVSDRIKRVNEIYKGESFNCTVALTDETEDKEPLAEIDVKVIVDGVEKTFKTDKDGKFVIEGLANGAHEVQLVIGNLDKAYYLDNYCGLVNLAAAATPKNPDTGLVLFKTNKF